MQVYVNLITLGIGNPDVSRGQLDGGIFISRWPLHWIPNFRGELKTLAFIPVNRFTALEVVSGISHADQAGNGFSQSRAIPLTTRHMAKGGDELPPSSRAKYQCF